ncbi:uncharacterized protein LOC123542998 [Mercenaria mercenaria]|uniref:uncharacterized protein LOC123542998 n=1 Tax=Mercenaria mercenaria TaxID=6596 RepID=UPI00234F3EF7|nr:uncharacterized protein LOC123542998 [Mercenaria mercenaria]
MIGVVIGTAMKISFEVHDESGSETNFISDRIRVSTTTAYLSTVVGVFVLTAILHLKECIYLLHGIWYLLCLPAGYLLLMIYSVCNITDRSWGTREENRGSDISFVQQFWCSLITKRFKSLCCNISTEEMTNQELQQDESDTTAELTDVLVGETRGVDSKRSSSGVDDAGRSSYTGVMEVSDWLPGNMKRYTDLFIRKGYENTIFISSMTDKDLRKIGITADIDRVALLSQIQNLPAFEIPLSVPTNLPRWLEEIGLKRYSRQFKNGSFDTKDVIERLKMYGKDQIKAELRITKRGHVKRVLYAIEQMREPSNREKKIEKVRKDMKTVHFGEMVNNKEKQFWIKLIDKCLHPQSCAFGSDKVLKEKLCALRNTWFIVFVLSNILWLILITTLSEEGNLLGVFGSNPVGFMVVLLFGFILIVQFLAMISHRFSTLKHYLARAPYICGSGNNLEW